MYKILPFLIAFFFVLPISNAFAANDYKSGLFDEVGHSFIKGDSLITDNDLLTNFRIGGGTPNPDVMIVLDQEVNITDAYVNLKFSTGNQSMGDIEYLDKSGNVIRKWAFPTLGYTGYHPVVAKNVKSVKFNFNGGYYLNEFELFGEVVPKDYTPIANLTETHNYNSVTLMWNNPDESDLKSIMLRRNGLEVAKIAPNQQSYTITNLNEETEYDFEVVAEYTDGGLSPVEKITVKTSTKPLDLNPPGEITDLAFGASSIGIKFTWVNPPDTDFSHIRIYRDNNLIENSHTQNTYEISGLVPNTTYVFKFVTVDENGNNSLGYIQTIKTDPEVDNIAPSKPSGLNLTNGNASGFLRWERNKELDLLGYNVYIDGIKHNASVVISNSYVISNLTNDESYEIAISAVDTSFNESDLSDAAELVPFSGGMPVFKTTYDLKLVADGTSSWFTALWPLLAFSVGIPLAFYISGRVKTLFFA